MSEKVENFLHDEKKSIKAIFVNAMKEDDWANNRMYPKKVNLK